MNINIKNIGFNVGTSGWLVDALKSGAVVIKEIDDNGHKLVFAHNKTNYLLVLLSEATITGGYYYHLVDDDYYCDPLDLGLSWLTNAAREAVTGVAQDWCDMQNASRENDAAITLHPLTA